MSESDPSFSRFPDLSALFDQPTTDQWRDIAEASLRVKPLEKLSVRTHEGLVVKPLFTAADEVVDIGYPGMPPHLRGRTALGPGPGGWSVCQAVTHPDPKTAATLAAEDLDRGADALWLIFASSVRTATEAADEPCSDGVCIAQAADLESLFEHLDPARHSIHLSAGGNTPAVAAAFAAAARHAGLNLHDLGGSIGFDPLGAIASDGELSAGIDGSFAALADLIHWTRLRAPGLKAAAVSTIPFHLAGGNAVQELGYALATAIDVARALEELGIEPDTLARQLLFRFAIGRDLFMEAAKLRAWRRIWSRAADASGVSDDGRAAMIHAVACPRGMTTRDPWVNSLRTTAGAFAAVVGGADITTVLPFDYAIGQSDDLGRRIAVNSQTILREESNLARVIDPGGGSWYLESLTDELARAAWSLFQSIEKTGGMTSALLDGRIADELEQTQTSREKTIATRRDPVTGVSSFPNLAEESVTRARAAAAETEATTDATEELAQTFTTATTATGNGELLDAAVAAAAAGAGVGRLSVAIRGTRDVTAMPPLPERREAAAFEALRDASDDRLSSTGARPRIFLANMGPIPEHKPRATFAKNFFEAGGIETIGNNGFETVEDAVEAFASTDTTMVVICSSDARYPDVIPGLAAALEGAGARTVLVAGPPDDHEETWRSAGVTGFIHVGCNVHQILVDLLEEEGVLHV